MRERLILTPCPPKKRCRVCEARLSQVFGSADHTNKYLYQAEEAGRKGRMALLADIETAVALFTRAAGFANLVLNHRYALPVTVAAVDPVVASSHEPTTRA